MPEHDLTPEYMAMVQRDIAANLPAMQSRYPGLQDIILEFEGGNAASGREGHILMDHDDADPDAPADEAAGEPEPEVETGLTVEEGRADIIRFPAECDVAETDDGFLIGVHLEEAEALTKVLAVPSFVFWAARSALAQTFHRLVTRLGSAALTARALEADTFAVIVSGDELGALARFGNFVAAPTTRDNTMDPLVALNLVKCGPLLARAVLAMRALALHTGDAEIAAMCAAALTRLPAIQTVPASEGNNAEA
ncbi:hypothetical protein [Komagataeibacter sp. FNDCR2]|uniref:hypothetical protein n=1 Tax=Komagataeibacter sp. FNDCR2 TaxID=2878682 RepID=UPI001E2E52D9|nr:hypothetical protein [Komagataeibacter sp. FNDCR2]MCE2576881.1 hypothetical protein [Komagataeibacter sp. FNDCR2]